MRAHIERSRDAFNPTKELGLSPRARFCTVIKGGVRMDDGYKDLVLKIYPDNVSIDALTGEAGVMVMHRQSVTVEKLAPGDDYDAVMKAGEPARTFRHAIDDGINCLRSSNKIGNS